MNDIFFATVKGHTVILDADFTSDFNPERWRVSDNKRGHKYVEADAYHPNKDTKGVVKLHRVVAMAKRDDHVDHVNGFTLDNRRSNLRACTGAQNSRNRIGVRGNPEGIKGVYYRPPDPRKRMKNGVWAASIGAVVDGKHKQVHIGHFKTKTEAIAAWNEAAKKYHGEFARLNHFS